MYAKVKLANGRSYVLSISGGISFTPKKMVSFKTGLSPDPTYYFGNNIIEYMGGIIAEESFDRVFFITTQSLHNTYGAEITGALEHNRIPYTTLIVADGEPARNFASVDNLCVALQEKGVAKHSILLGFGGGSLADIVGVTSSILLRGLRYIEMPASLMAATDGCLSNKQAVNGQRRKNQHTTFYAPHCIFCDTKYLQTEGITGRRAALAEGLKNAFINDASLLYSYEEGLKKTDLANLDHFALSDLAFNIICSKLAILKKDPTEHHSSAALEYGHTFGYAIEFLSRGAVPHGIAVAKGICIAAELSRRMGYLSREEVERHFYFFGELLGIDLCIPKTMAPESIMAKICAGSGTSEENARYVLLERIGRCLHAGDDYRIPVGDALVRSVLRDYSALAEGKLRKELPLHDESIIQHGSPA